jgi:hypothetical protein
VRQPVNVIDVASDVPAASADPVANPPTDKVAMAAAASVVRRRVLNSDFMSSPRTRMGCGANGATHATPVSEESRCVTANFGITSCRL